MVAVDTTSDDESFHSAAENEEVVLAPPSQHSYLPGASHPLHHDAYHSVPEQDIRFNQSHSVNHCQDIRRNQNDPFELIIVELPGVVLFPGMTIPLRLEEPGSFSSASCFWTLHRQIQQSRKYPGQAGLVQVGILTKLDPLMMEDENSDNHNSPAEIGRRRASWMRRRYGPERLRRFSEQLIQELGNLQELLDLDEAMSSDEEAEQPPPPPARREQSRASRTLAQTFNRQRRSPTRATTDQGPPQEEQEVEFLHRRRVRRRNGPDSNNQRIGRANAQVNSSTSESDDDDQYAFRIGTLAVVTYTHGDEGDVLGTNEASVATNNNGRARNRASLVLTAVGTGRFRILPHNVPAGQRPTENNEYHYNRLFVRNVEQFCNERMPQIPRLLGHKENAIASILGSKTNFRSSTLAAVSVWPPFIYDTHWPFTLMEKVLERLKSIPSLSEIVANAEEEQKLPSQPSQFSFWLGIHLPLSEKEKIELLLCPTITERLQWFLAHALFQAPSDEGEEHADPTDSKMIVCKSCQIPLASARDLFSLDGAEGTVGNYVNPHGIVHSTMTSRAVDRDEIALQGQPETRDSWFPGYAWTIMSCALCHSHLGWKFTLVAPKNSSHNRPDHFFGLSASCVNMVTQRRRSRRASGRRRTRRQMMNANDQNNS